VYDGEDPIHQDGAEDTRIFVDVAKNQYSTTPTTVYLEDDTTFCLRVYKGPEEELFGDPYGANRIVVALGYDIYADIVLFGIGPDVECFTTPSSYSTRAELVTRHMCIYSEKAKEPEGPDGTFWGSVLAKEWGHAAIALIYQNSESDGPWIKTYGKWGQEGDNNILEDYCHDWPGNDQYKYFYCEEISYQQWKDAETYVKNQDPEDSDWTATNNCASFASDIFKAVTNVEIVADDADVLYSETPHELGRSIIKKNGGSYGTLPVTVSSRSCSRRKNLRG
jgi:hypothetical protein